MILRIVIPIGLIAWLVLQVDWRTLWPLIRRTPWWIFLASASLFILSEIVIAVRWYFLLRFQGLKVPFRRILGLVFVGIFASNFLPTTIGGDVIKMGAVAQDQEKRGVAVASVVADRLYNIAGMIILLPLALVLKGIHIPGLKADGFVLLIAFAGWVNWSKLQNRIKRTWQDVRKWFVSMKCIVPALFLSWLSISFAFCAFWVIAVGMGIPISYWQASAVSLLTYFIALIPIAINGLGIQEGSRTYLLILQGASTEQATAAAFLIRLVTMTVSLLGGVRLLWGWQDLLKTRQKPDPAVSERVVTDPPGSDGQGV
jgi:glycosyltransferase 2 family protein